MLAPLNEGAPIHQQFPVEMDYACCVSALSTSGILTYLPNTGGPGVIGIDEKEYPLLTLDQVIELFNRHRELVAKNVSQCFEHLQLTPMAIPTYFLIDQLKAAILKHAWAGEIFQTRCSLSDPLILVWVNPEKQIWVWE